MKRICFLFCLVWLLALAGQQTAYAHAVEWAEVSMPVRVIALRYSSGEPMAYAPFKVFAPSDKKIERQKGNADKNGFVAFAVTEPGEWLVAADDGLGHKVSASFTLDEAGTQVTRGNPGLSGTPLLMRVLLGLSLLGNAYGCWYVWMARRKWVAV